MPSNLAHCSGTSKSGTTRHWPQISWYWGLSCCVPAMPPSPPRTFVFPRMPLVFERKIICSNMAKYHETMRHGVMVLKAQMSAEVHGTLCPVGHVTPVGCHHISRHTAQIVPPSPGRIKFRRRLRKFYLATKHSLFDSLDLPSF